MRRLLWVAILLAMTGSPNANATVPQVFSVQGVLRDSSGKLQTMAITVTTNFYDSQTGGNLLNPTPYIATNVMAVSGLFTVTFSDAMITTNLSKTMTGQLWLELTTGNDTFPRQQVTPGIWALMAGQADHAATADTATNATNATSATSATNATTAATASALSCSGCVTAAMIQTGALSPKPTVTAQGANSISLTTGSHGFACSTCASGVLVGGNCYWDVRQNQLYVTEAQIQGTQFCCSFGNDSGGTNVGHSTANCLTISSVP